MKNQCGIARDTAKNTNQRLGYPRRKTGEHRNPFVRGFTENGPIGFWPGNRLIAGQNTINEILLDLRQREKQRHSTTTWFAFQFPVLVILNQDPVEPLIFAPISAQ